jgi:hypothetical protein
MVMGSTARHHPSGMAGHLCLGMDQRGNMVVVTMRGRRVMAGLFVALAQERPIPSGRGRERTRVQERNASGLPAWGVVMLGESGIFPDLPPSVHPGQQTFPSLSPSIDCTDAPPRPLRQRPSV